MAAAEGVGVRGVETVADFIFLDSKITVDGECGHEIKDACSKARQHMKKQRRYFAHKGPFVVCLVKAMVFPVVMHGCESWTIKKLSAEELMLLNCGVGEDY